MAKHHWYNSLSLKANMMMRFAEDRGWQGSIDNDDLYVRYVGIAKNPGWLFRRLCL